MERGRASDEHPFEHLLDHPKVPGITDEIGSVLLECRPREGHVVSQDVVLDAVLRDGAQRLV